MFTDQSAMPTFVECKRYDDTRSRREVIGQVFEYAANGHYYWSKDMMRTFAEEAAENNGTTIEEAIQALRPDGEDIDTPDGFFTRVQDNLREGQIRIVFFLEEAPMELKSIVDFLNKQMERSEVLLVESRQFSLNGITVVSPILFGFTEEARQVKRRVTVSNGSATRSNWTESSFFEAVDVQLPKADGTTIRKLFDFCEAKGFTIEFGKGATPAFMIKRPPVFSRSLITVDAAGLLYLNFGWMEGSDLTVDLRDSLKDGAVTRLDLSISDDYARKFPSFKWPAWRDKVSELTELLGELASKCNVTPA